MKKAILSHEEISTLCLELALLLHAGVDGGSGMTLLAEETQEPGMKTLLGDMARAMDEGAPLSQTVADAGCFPANVAAMLRVGEATGRSEEALRALAEYYERRAQADRRIRSGLLYPAILLLIMLVVVVVLLTQVLPIFHEVYASLGGQLTGLAGGLLALGRWLNTALPVLGVLLAAVVLVLAVFAASETFRGRVLEWWQKRRGDKGLSRSMSAARFAQALSMALSSGLTAEEALTAAGELLGDQPAAAARVQQALALVRSGVGLPGALRQTELLPAAECRLLELGYASGSGETAMAEIARRVDQDAEDALDRLLGRVEPTMVVVTSLLVGVILLSVMLPLTRIMAAIG